jgi:uncharacterized membrane protein YfcA
MLDLVIPNLIVCFAGLVQASVGIGFGMIAVPLLVLIDPIYAPGPALFVMLFLSVAMVAGGWKNIDRQGLSALLPGLAGGTVVGVLVVGGLSVSTFELVFGALVLLAVVVGQSGWAPPRRRAISGAGGFVAGLMGTISGMHGPPLAVLYQRAEPAAARATIALVFVIGSVLSLVSLNLGGLFAVREITAGLYLLPGLAAGFVLSRVGRAHISDGFARTVMSLVAAASALILIGRNIF